MIERVGLHTNLGKTKAMVCTPGLIWGQKEVEEYKRRDMGEGATFREWNKNRVSCKECGATMVSSLLLHHMEHAHRIFIPHNRGVEVGGGGPETYVVSLLRVLK